LNYNGPFYAYQGYIVDSLTVDGNVILNNSGTDSTIVKGDFSIKADDGTTNKFTVDNATGNTVISGTLAVNTGTISTSVGTFNLLNTTATTVNFAGGASSLTMGAGTGLTTVSGKLKILGSTSPAAGELYTGTTDPSQTTRLNYNGELRTYNSYVTNDLTVNNNVTVNGNIIGTSKVTVPIGFIYFQLQGELSPSNLFVGTWKYFGQDSTLPSMAGLFFRAEGTDALGFESILTISTSTTTSITFTTNHNLIVGDLVRSSKGEWRTISVINSATQITVSTAFSTAPTGTVYLGQNDQLLSHTHDAWLGGGNWDDNAGGSGFSYVSNGAWRQTNNPNSRHGTENRPKNTVIRVWKRTA